MTRERIYLFDTTLRDGTQTQSARPQAVGRGRAGEENSPAGSENRP
jgi:hypothetical protein